jgi:hypothetical protein
VSLTALCGILDTGILEALGATVSSAGTLSQCRTGIVGGAAESTSSYIIAIGRRIVRIGSLEWWNDRIEQP